MKSQGALLFVRVLTGCLTIFQFGVASAATPPAGAPPAANRAQLKKKPAPKNAIPDKVFATAAVRADEEELNFATAERADMGGYTVPRTWLSADQTIGAPVPLNGMLITRASLEGSLVKANVTAQTNTAGVALNATSSSTSFGPKLELAYGLSDNIYFTAGGAYQPSRSESQTSSTITTTGNQNSTATSDGWKEPMVGVGLTGRIGRRARLTFELDGMIPLGNARTETSGSSSNSNGLTGGALVPKIMAVTQAGRVKFVGTLSYTYQFERTTETLVNGRLGSSVSTGGHQFSTQAGLELPYAYNLGFAGIYSRTEPTSTSGYRPYSNNGSAGGVSFQSSSPGVQSAGAAVYMGIAIPDTNIVLMPSVLYGTVLDREVERTAISQLDIWQFSFRGIVHF